MSQLYVSFIPVFSFTSLCVCGLVIVEMILVLRNLKPPAFCSDDLVGFKVLITQIDKVRCHLRSYDDIFNWVANVGWKDACECKIKVEQVSSPEERHTPWQSVKRRVVSELLESLRCCRFSVNDSSKVKMASCSLCEIVSVWWRVHVVAAEVRTLLSNYSPHSFSHFLSFLYLV